MGMELAFDTIQLRNWCEDPNKLLGSMKPKVVEQLKHRLADIRAANSPLDLLAGSPRLLDGKPARVVLRLADGYVLNCVVNHNTPRVDDTGKTDWSRVRRLRVTSIREASR